LELVEGTELASFDVTPLISLPIIFNPPLVSTPIIDRPGIKLLPFLPPNWGLSSSSYSSSPVEAEEFGEELEIDEEDEETGLAKGKKAPPFESDHEPLALPGPPAAPALPATPAPPVGIVRPILLPFIGRGLVVVPVPVPPPSSDEVDEGIVEEEGEGEAEG